MACIFGHLHKYFVLDDKTANFIDGYRVNYEINGFNVSIESIYVSSKTNTFRPIIRINDEELSISQIKSRFGSFKLFLPEKIILSYSGITDHLKNLSNHFEAKFINRIIRKDNPYSLNPLFLPEDNPFMYVKKEYVSFVILALLVLNTKDAHDILKEIGLDINGCTIRIALKKPDWAKSKVHKNDNDALWGMEGKIASDFLKGLDIVGIKANSPNDALHYSFDFYGSPMIQDLFLYHYNLQPNQVIPFMDTILCNGLLESVTITWGESFSIDRLSEGEKQLILSVGLGLVMKKKNLLFLLDEPDVSLHPTWQREFISNISKGLDKESMAIISTHSPILVSDLQNTSVIIVRDGKTCPLEGLYSYGRDTNSILEDYFGIEERNKEGQNLIQSFYNAMTSKDYDKAETLLNEIEATFGPSDISTVKATSVFDDLAD